MLWIQPVDVFDMIWKGILIGVVVSAPMGPVGVLCVQRTLNKGRWFGFVTGIGAACSDLIYSLITGFALSYLVEFIEKPQTMFALQIFGSMLLFAFGLWSFFSRPVNHLRPASKTRGTLIHNAVTAFFVTLSNPLIVFLILGLFARFNFITPGHPLEQAIGYLAIVAGALGWWFVLTHIVDKVRARFDVRGIWMINRVIGVIVMAASVIGVILTITGKSLY